MVRALRRCQSSIVLQQNAIPKLRYTIRRFTSQPSQSPKRGAPCSPTLNSDYPRQYDAWLRAQRFPRNEYLPPPKRSTKSRVRALKQGSRKYLQTVLPDESTASPDQLPDAPEPTIPVTREDSIAYYVRKDLQTALPDESTASPDQLPDAPEPTIPVTREDSIAYYVHLIRHEDSSEAVWAAYTDLLELQPPREILDEKDFRRIFSRLANEKPRTRTTFLRMLELCNAIHSLGFEMKPWQWTVLTDSAAKGFHKTHEEDYHAALDVVNDWYRRTQKDNEDELVPGEWDKEESPINIYTYTTLLAIAARTNSPDLLRHASRLLEHSQLPPTRITELSVIPYLARSGEYLAVKAVIENVHAKGMEVGIDGLNALMWAYASNGAFEYPMGIYRALRSRTIEEFPHTELQDIDPVNAIGDYIIPEDLEPDRVTYTLLIQALAYHGHLPLALEIFRDLLCLEKPPPMSRRYKKAESEHIADAHLIPIYRAFFLGFSRHGEPQAFQLPKPRSPLEAERYGPLQPDGRPIMSPWNVHNLQIIFNMFMECASDCLPNNRTIFWILKGFARTTWNSIEKMKSIWEQLDSRFAPTLGWQGRMKRVKEDLENDRIVLERTRINQYAIDRKREQYRE